MLTTVNSSLAAWTARFGLRRLALGSDGLLGDGAGAIEAAVIAAGVLVAIVVRRVAVDVGG